MSPRVGDVRGYATCRMSHVYTGNSRVVSEYFSLDNEYSNKRH